MASNIISETIDGAYPQAGVDNDTQGFRDNFSIIKGSLAAAKQEVEDLQLNSAKLNEANNFAGNNLIEANLQSVTHEFFNPDGILENSQNVNFDNGHYQKFELNEDSSTPIKLTMDRWPADGVYGKLAVEIVKTGGSDIFLEFDTLNSNGGTGTVMYSGFTVPAGGTGGQFLVDEDNKPYLFEFATYDGGDNVYATYIGNYTLKEDIV